VAVFSHQGYSIYELPLQSYASDIDWSETTITAIADVLGGLRHPLILEEHCKSKDLQNSVVFLST